MDQFRASRLVDPTICPDCRTPLAAGGSCPGCGLRLQGPLATTLWQTMQAADRIIAQLRLQAAVPAPVATPAPPTPPNADLPERRRMPALTVPVVLLSLGALFLLVAATVFIAVTWDLLGLTGRTLVLVGATTMVAAVGVVLSRRGLRGAAETFWLIVAGMVVMDLLGAQEADLAGLGSLSWREFSALLGAALLVLGAGASWWAGTQPVRRLYGAEAVGVCGALLLTATNGWAATQPAVGTVIAVVLLAAAALSVRRTLRVLGSGLAVLAALSWVVLLGIGWDRAAALGSPAAWWTEFRGWPLLAAAVLAAIATLRLRTVPDWVRSGTAALALLPLVLLVNAPQTFDDTRTALLASLTLTALAAVTAFAPLLWARGAAALAALGVVGFAAVLLANALDMLEGLPTGTLPSDTRVPLPDADFSSWAAGALALAAVLALLSAPRLLAGRLRERAWPAVTVLVAAAAAIGAVDVVLLLRPALWLAVVALGAGTCFAAGATWVHRNDGTAAALGGLSSTVLAALTLAAASHADVLLALVATVFAVALAAAFALRDREHGGLSVVPLAAGAALLGGLALTGWGMVLEADSAARAVALAGYAALVGLVAAPAARRTAGRVSLEGSALALALISLAAVPDAPALATCLTIIGSGAGLVSVLFADRRLLGWVGAAVLAVATFVRVLDDVRAPELYTLPAAALLVGAGLWRLSEDRRADSLSNLGSGLVLALVPSLLLALDEPVSVRGALVGLGSLAVLSLGIWQRLATPLVLGAASSGLLALRHLEPVADAVPRWLSLGLVGLALLAVGITWEARLRDLRSARHYLTGLR